MKIYTIKSSITSTSDIGTIDEYSVYKICAVSVTFKYEYAPNVRHSTVRYYIHKVLALK